MLSIYVAPLDGRPCLLREPDRPYYAASTAKVAVLAALYRSGLDLDASVPVVNSFTSAVPGPPYRITPDQETDAETWRLLGGRTSLHLLARQMIVHSSNLATNLILERVGFAAVNEVWRLAGARRSGTHRGIQDSAARTAGVTNLVTAADLARLLCWLPPEQLDLLAANIHRVDLAAGLPPGTRIAFKNGWIDGIRHSAGIIHPDDAPPYVIAACYQGPLANGDATADPAARLLARISARVWRATRSRGPLGTLRKVTAVSPGR